MRGLTYKQRQFCWHYVGEAKGNATKAALLAGYSKRAAAQQGAENLRKPYIVDEIDRLRTELQDLGSVMTPQEMHEMWAWIARNPFNSVDERLAAIRDCARANRMFVTQIEAKHTIERPEQTMSDDELIAEAARLAELTGGIEA